MALFKKYNNEHLKLLIKLIKVSRWYTSLVLHSADLKWDCMIDWTGQISISLYKLALWSPTLDKAICTTVHQTKKIVYRALVTNIPDIQNFGTNCAPLVADLFWFCYERYFMLSLSDNYQTHIIEAFNSTSRYLDDLLNIDNPYTLNKW